jgi:site-specific recombinase XerD
MDTTIGAFKGQGGLGGNRVRAAIEEWLAYCRRNMADNTVLTYSRALDRFALFVGELPLDQVSLNHIERYIDMLLIERKRSSVNTWMVAIRSFYTYHAKRHGVPNLPRDIPRLKEDDPEQRVLSEEEYAAVLGVCRKPNEREVIQLLGHTGLRRSEFCRLRPRDISPDMTFARISNAKGRKTRTVPLDALCREILTRCATDTHGYSFHLRYGDANGVERLCKRLANRTGLEPFGPHALRHFFATRLLRAGVSLKKVSLILGHASAKTTEQVYCHLVPQDVIGVTEGFAT